MNVIKSLQNKKSFISDSGNAYDYPLIKNLPKKVLTKKLKYGVAKYIILKSQESTYQNNCNFNNYTRGSNIDQNPLLKQSKIFVQTGPYLHKTKPNRLSMSYDTKERNYESSFVPQKEVYCQGWFGDKTQMKFRMDSYYSRMKSKNKTEEIPYDKKMATTITQDKIIDNKNKQQTFMKKRANSFQVRDKSNRRFNYEMQSQNRKKINFELLRATDQVSKSYNSMIRQIRQEVKKEQQEQFQISRVDTQLCNVANSKSDLEMLWEKSKINVSRLKTFGNIKYRTPMDELIERLKK